MAFGRRAAVGLAAVILGVAAAVPAGSGGVPIVEGSMAQEQEVKRARADISGEGITGAAEFVEVEQGTQRLVRVTVRVQGDPSVLTPGLHGVHIHEQGVCEAPFQSAGGHFDPGPAGDSDPDVNHPYHMGDLPNIQVDEQGNGVLEAVTSRITLSDGPLSILGNGGTALMIHGHQDQLTSGERASGVSGGPRLACGVIRPAS